MDANTINSELTNFERENSIFEIKSSPKEKWHIMKRDMTPNSIHYRCRIINGKLLISFFNNFTKINDTYKYTSRVVWRIKNPLDLEIFLECIADLATLQSGVRDINYRNKMKDKVSRFEKGMKNLHFKKCKPREDDNRTPYIERDIEFNSICFNVHQQLDDNHLIIYPFCPKFRLNERIEFNAGWSLWTIDEVKLFCKSWRKLQRFEYK